MEMKIKEYSETFCCEGPCSFHANNLKLFTKKEIDICFPQLHMREKGNIFGLLKSSHTLIPE